MSSSPAIAPDTDYTAVDSIVRELVDTVALYMHNVPYPHIESEIFRAYHFARNAHEGQLRKSGDPYIIHPAEAALILATLKPDLITLQCCFLHDVPEDTTVSVEEISLEF